MIQKRQILPKISQKRNVERKKFKKFAIDVIIRGEMYMALNLKNDVVLQERLFMAPNR